MNFKQTQYVYKLIIFKSAALLTEAATKCE
jgi:hypothetical protein